MEENKSLHFNKPQMRSMLIDASEEYAVWGRGTGKSEGLIAPRSIRNIHSMPRSSGVFVGATYLQILDRTLPPVIKGWERLGYVRDVHFWIRTRPPKKFNLPKAYYEPETPEHCIYWYNGSIIRLVSQDRAGSANGQTNDWIFGDEAKLLNKQKLDDELLPTNRGNIDIFGHLPEHHSLLFCSDMPTSIEGKWLLEKEKDMDPEQINLMLQVQRKILDLQHLAKKANGKVLEEIEASIKLHKDLFNELRFDSVYFSEASTLDNIEALGIKFIKQMKRTLPDLVFRSSILNERIIQIENGFYPHFDEWVHCYDAIDYGFVNSFGPNIPENAFIDCRKDADLILERPLDMAMDYGATINTMVIGQEIPSRFNVINALYVKHPQRLKDICKLFCDYYATHKVKEVNYYYDHTAIATDASRIETYADEVTKELSRRGWKVNKRYIGQASSHDTRFKLWGHVLKGDDTRFKMVRLNKTNCKFLILSMQQAGVIQKGNKFEKDKRPERNTSIDQAETTHFSDAIDTLYVGKFSDRIGQPIPSLSIIY